MAEPRHSGRSFCAWAVFFLGWLAALSGQQPQNLSAERKAEESFRAKYTKVDVFRYNATASGPSGLFFLSGDLKARAGVGQAQLSAATPQDVASEFLRNEAGLLDLEKPEEELREQRSEKEQNGRTHVFYTKYIAGLKVDGVDLRVHLEPDGTIFAVNGNLVPVPATSMPSVVAAARASHLTEEQVQSIVRADLGQDPDILFRTEKVIIPSEPFVVWKVDAVLEKKLGRWMYTINAFTGAVLSKINGLQS